MAALANIVSDLGNAIVGNEDTTTSLDDFLSKYTSSTGKYVDTLDPLTTFEVNIKFYPTIAQETTSNKNIVDRITSSLNKSITSAVTNAANSITGGLLGSLLLDETPKQLHNTWTSKDGNQTFAEMLAEGNLLVGSDSWNSNSTSSPLELNLGPYVQEVTIPNLIMADGGMQTTLLGEFANNGTYIKPDNNRLIMTVVNTKAALHERLFYPWMKEVTLPYWSYRTQPYTTATITIDFTKHNKLKYVFCGCRPSQIFSLQAKQDVTSGENLTRQVMFIFDFMYVHSDLKNIDSISQKINNTIGTIFNNVGSVIKL